MRIRNTVRHTFIDNQLAVLYPFRRSPSRSIEGDDLIVVTVDDQRRHIELLQILMVPNKNILTPATQ